MERQTVIMGDKLNENSPPSQLSTLTLAFASLILLNKPPELTATEFIFYLRGCIQKEPSSKTTKLYKISNDNYWRNICEDKDLKISELDQKLIDANIENERLASLLNKRKDEEKDGPKGKRTKPDQTANAGNLVSWEPVKKHYENIPSSSDGLFTSLRALHYADDTQNVCVCIVNLCKCISTRVRKLCSGSEEKMKPEHASQAIHRARETRQNDPKGLRQRLLDSTWAESVVKSLDDTFRRLLMGIRKISLSSANEPKLVVQGATNNVTEAVSNLMFSIMDSLHIASRTFGQNEGTRRARDIRPGMVNILQSFISTLNGDDEIQANILEASIYVVVETAGRCLCVPKKAKIPDSKAGDADMKALAETSKYILELMKVIVPLYRKQIATKGKSNTNSERTNNDSPVLELAKQKFHEFVMKGLFGELKTPEWKHLKSYSVPAKQIGTNQWGGIQLEDEFEFVDEENFANELWKLLELEDFALVW